MKQMSRSAKKNVAATETRRNSWTPKSAIGGRACDSRGGRCEERTRMNQKRNESCKHYRGAEDEGEKRGKYESADRAKIVPSKVRASAEENNVGIRTVTKRVDYSRTHEV